jgi:hypothetical protein
VRNRLADEAFQNQMGIGWHGCWQNGRSPALAGNNLGNMAPKLAIHLAGETPFHEAPEPALQ